jgi:GNAT superfamily N-acetyltransferase
MELGIDYDIRIISPTDNSKPFSTGDQAFLPLKTFLQKQAYEFTSAMVAKTWVAVQLDNGVDNGNIIGYITLICSEIDLCNGYSMNDCVQANQYDWMPALKIARLAVDKRYRGHNIGLVLVDIAMNIAIDDLATKIGCRFLITDAKQQSIQFYEKAGFTMLDSEDNKKAEHPIMFVDLLHVVQANI